MNIYYSFNNGANNTGTANPSGASTSRNASSSNAASAGNTNSNTNTNNNNQSSVILWDNEDDFDSDQLDEDESYSWASGITDHQDGVGTGNGTGNNGGGGCNSGAVNWRDWRPNNPNDIVLNMNRLNQFGLEYIEIVNNVYQKSNLKSSGQIPKLVDLCAKFTAANIPFELVESFRLPVPEELQLKITFSSFPDSVENIRLYSCLANGSVDEYMRGEQLYHHKCVRKIIQIGFHLSAQVASSNTVVSSTTNAPSSNFTSRNGSNGTLLNINNGVASVAIVCDRKRIVSCHCTCSKQTVPWCSHVVAVCLYRILEPHNVELRAPVSESLSKLHRDQLQKFAQYLISELPQQVRFVLFLICYQ